MKFSTNPSVKKKPILILTALICLVFTLSFSILESFALPNSEPVNLVGGNDNSVVLQVYEKSLNGQVSETAVKGTYFKLFKEDSNGVSQPFGSFLTDSTGKLKADNLPAGDYYFQQLHSPYGYSFDTDVDDNNINNYHFTIDNENNQVNLDVYNRRLYSSFEIKNTVTNLSNLEPTYAQKIEIFEFYVTFSDNKTYSYQLNGIGEMIEPTENKVYLRHNDFAKFSDIPVGVTYNVIQLPKNNYSTFSTDEQSSIVADNHKTANFINTYYTEFQPYQSLVTVEKKINGHFPDSDDSKRFYFTLFVDGTDPTQFSLLNNESKTFEIEYGKNFYVVEDNYFNDGYVLSSLSRSFEPSNSKVNLSFVGEFVQKEWTIVEGEKTWNLSNNAEISLPDNVIIQLKNGGTVVSEQFVVPSNNGTWKYRFIAPKYDDYQTEQISYAISEIPIAGFNSIINGFDVENIAIPPTAPPTITPTASPIPLTSPITVSPVEVEKQILGDTPEIDEEFTFVLVPINNAPIPQGSVENKKEVVITGSGNTNLGEIIFSDSGYYLYKLYEKSGNLPEYIYDDAVYTVIIEIKRDAAQNSLYVASCTYLKENDETIYYSAIFKNKYTAPPSPSPTLSPAPSPMPINPNQHELVTINGFKFWNHGSNPKNKQPSYATLNIFADGKKTLTFNVTEKSHWRWSYDLPKYNYLGNEIVYSIDEDTIKDYTKIIDGFNIINTHVTAPAGETSALLIYDDEGNLIYDSSVSPNYNNSSSKNSANTGDRNALPFWVLSALSSAFAFAFSVIFIRPLLKKT